MSPIPCENIDDNTHSNGSQEQSSDSNNYSDIELNVDTEFETKSLKILNGPASDVQIGEFTIWPINESKIVDSNVKPKPFRTVCCKY